MRILAGIEFPVGYDGACSRSRKFLDEPKDCLVPVLDLYPTD